MNLHSPSDENFPSMNEPTTRSSDDGSLTETARDRFWSEAARRWKENHATALVIVAMTIFLIGSAILQVRRSRFVPPGFPPGDKLVPAPGLSNADDEGVSLQIRVVGGASDAGPVRVAVYTSADTFNQPESAAWKGTTTIDPSGEAICYTDGITLTGEFAVAAFHDLNDDGELSRNALGIPSERYGFSNDARGKFGPPSFQEAKINMPADGDIIDISIR